MAGLEEITAGELLIDGQQVNDVPLDKRGLAMVFQTYALYPHMTDIFRFQDKIDSLGIYLQDQIAITNNLKFLLSGRFDIINQNSSFNGVESQQQDQAFTPRLGVVYQPLEPLSLYASFSQSFTPNSATTVDGELLSPERGTQFDGRLTANLAAYNLSKRNIAVADPNNTDFSIAVGEQRSRGIELDVIGEISPG